MSTKLARAYPRKSFFAQMFRKDISLEDCVLDLIGNSVDGFISSRKLRLSEIASAIWDKKAKRHTTAGLPSIEITLSESRFEIWDNCGGIDLDDALNEVFNFGHSIGWNKTESLGVYGIGLKRALFKLGDHFEINSRTSKNGFHCKLDVGKWVQEDDSPADWNIPITEQAPASSASTAGTKITVNQLHAEVRERLRSGTVDASLHRAISTTFCFFLE